MPRLTSIALTLLLIAAPVSAQDADIAQPVRQALKAGSLDEAKKLCAHWIEKKPKDERPHILLGQIHLKQDKIDEAIEAFETARELNPLNPDPACEMGRLFIKAGMGQEAVAEFESALKVRKDYEPAVKGLAEALALTENPYRDGVSVKLGEFNEERGLRQLDRPGAHISRAAKMAGRDCRATEIAKKQLFLDFDVDDEYLHDVDLPVRVTVEYFDIGRDRFSMKYDSTDLGAHFRGTAKTTEQVTKTDTRAWKRYTFNLPDARFSGWSGRDFVLSTDVWRGEADLYVASVHVVQGGLQIQADPKSVAVGQQCTVIAKVVDAEGTVPDGTSVKFSADSGQIEESVETVAGEARAAFMAPADPGEATITVKTDEDERKLSLPILRGKGESVRRKLVVYPFGRRDEWRVSGRRDTELKIEPAPDAGREGRPATRVAYKLNQTDSKSMATMARAIPLPGRPTKIGVWVHADQSPNMLRIEFRDATRQVHGCELGTLTQAGWQWMETPVGTGMYHHSGANDGRIHFPIQFGRLVFRRYYSAQPQKAEGEILFQDLTVETDLPASETVELTVTSGRPRAQFEVGENLALQIRLSNVTEEPRRGRLRWIVTDADGTVVLDERRDEFELPAQSRVAKDVGPQRRLPAQAAKVTRRAAAMGGGGRTGRRRALGGAPAVERRPAPEGGQPPRSREDARRAVGTSVAPKLNRPGVLQAKLVFETDDDEAEPPTDSITLLLTREVGKLGLSAEIQPAPKIATVLVTNRRQEDAHISLLYRILNQQREVLAKGALGQPNMTVPAGEAVECPLPLGELPPDRYTVFLLFDTTDGKRFTALLPYEALPAELTVNGEVTGDGKPLPGASVRMRIARQPHRYTRFRAESLGSWTTETDADGKYSFKAIKVPQEAERCRLHFDVVARGFADHQTSHSFRYFLPSGGQPSRTIASRLKRGAPLTARVIGADGEPVAGARVHALSVVTEERRARQIRSYRLRETDADGRFELCLVPDSKTDLVVYSSQWATRRVIVSPGQSDLGEIHLEAGTTVSGKLLDANGEPADGYWVVAEKTVRRASRMLAHPVRVGAKTEADGSFTLPPLKGKFTFWTPPSYEIWWTEPTYVSPLPPVAIVPQVHTFDGTEDPVELALQAPPTARISGRVLGMDGKPATDAGLMLYTASTDLRSPLVFDAATTDADGRFSFTGIPHGLRNATIVVPGMRRSSQGGRVYLRAKPLKYASGNQWQESAHLPEVKEDVLDVDFQYRLWSSKDGYLEPPQKKEEEKPANE